MPKIHATCNRLQLPSKTFAVKIESCQEFIAIDLDVEGRILSEHGQLLNGLLDDETILLHASCTVALDDIAQEKPFQQLPCSLELTIYGPIDLFRDIGEWFQAYDVYIQDPRECHQNVKYCNPHRLCADDWQSCPLLADFLLSNHGSINLENLPERTDLLNIISGQDHLQETIEPTLLAATLHRYTTSLTSICNY